MQLTPNSYKRIFWCLHLALFIIVFQGFIFHPNNLMFSPSGDGLKNYFTLETYVHQPVSSGYFKYDAMHYPYGDYVWFTDNSPLLAIIFRFVHLNIHPIGNIAPLMHLLVLLNVLLAPIVVIKLLKRFVKNEWLIIAGMFLLVWGSPQLFRLFGGHYNLSLSIFYFIAINWTFNWYAKYTEDTGKSNLRLAVTLFLLLFISATIHLYYLILLGLPIGIFLLVSTLAHVKKITIRWREIVSPMATLAVVTGVVYFLMHFTDSYLHLRSEHPDGSNIKSWQAHFFNLYKAKQDINSLNYIGGKVIYEPENAPYLGNFFWYIGTLILVFFIADCIKKRKLITPKISSLGVVAFLSSLLVFYSAMGSGFNLFGLGNIVSPLFYVGKIYPAIINFRCLGRLSWWCFYLSQFVILIALDKYIAKSHLKWFKVFLFASFALIALDVFDSLKFNNTKVGQNAFSPQALEKIPAINYDEYQAILPVPYYSVGSENYHFTIDENVNWCTYNYQLQLKSGLPTMGVRLSRIPVEFVDEIFSIFTDTSINSSLLAKLNDKPILVVYDSAVKETSNLEPAASVIEIGPTIIEKYNMKALITIGSITYYRWDVK